MHRPEKYPLLIIMLLCPNVMIMGNIDFPLSLSRPISFDIQILELENSLGYCVYLGLWEERFTYTEIYDIEIFQPFSIANFKVDFFLFHMIIPCRKPYAFDTSLL